MLLSMAINSIFHATCSLHPARMLPRAPVGLIEEWRRQKQQRLIDLFNLLSWQCATSEYNEELQI